MQKHTAEITTTRMPALFIGHGNPMLAITDNPYRESWLALGKTLPRPQAILCISAHWETDGTQLCVAEHPKTIHDFGGFPDELFAQQYPAPGAPAYADAICDLFEKGTIIKTTNWGLDHGAWTILQSLFPNTDVPVMQLSLNKRLNFSEHFALARKLASLRSQGIMIMSSGNIVHNLARLDFSGNTHEWAIQFDLYIQTALEVGDEEALIHIERAGLPAQLSVPTSEHYLPLLYIAAIKHAEDTLRFFNDNFDLGALSMRSFIYK